MKKFFALAILLSTSLTGQCFADDLEKNFYVDANIIILGELYHGDEIAIDHLKGSIIRGYNYTENIRAELEIMFAAHDAYVYSGTFLANLCYYNKIKSIDLTPYFGIGVGTINYLNNWHVETFLVQ